MVGRRTFLEITGSDAVAAVAGACRASRPDSEAARLRVMLNGGIYEELARRLVIDPFEKDGPITLDDTSFRYGMRGGVAERFDNADLFLRLTKAESDAIDYRELSGERDGCLAVPTANTIAIVRASAAITWNICE